MPPEDHLGGWNPREMEWMNHVELFLHKPVILKKAEALLNGFKNAMVRELEAAPAPYPPETDTTRGQIARGENNKGFPYVSLDMPQMFSKTEMFTLRTLFWWGHYLGHFLILKGSAVPASLDALAARRASPELSGVVFSIWPTPWEWGVESFSPIADLPKEEIRRLVKTHGYIKVGRIYPLSAPGFHRLDWTSAGLDAWRILSGITRP